jgi:hypothetical protein
VILQNCYCQGKDKGAVVNTNHPNLCQIKTTEPFPSWHFVTKERDVDEVIAVTKKKNCHLKHDFPQCFCNYENTKLPRKGGHAWTGD